MLRSSLLGYLAKLYASIATLTDNKFYGFKNGEMAEIVSGGGTVTTSNMLDIIRNTYSHNLTHYPLVGGYRYTASGGIGVSASTVLDWGDVLGSDITGSGTASGLISKIGFTPAKLTTGSTATGNTSYTSPLYFPRSLAGASLAPINFAAYHLYFKAKTPAALSDATNTYNIQLNGNIGSMPVTLYYTHGTNSGKWQIQTKNEAGSTILTDSTVTVAANTTYAVVFEVIWNAATSKFNLTVSIQGTVVATITDLFISAAGQVTNTSSYSYMNTYQKLTKSVGATATTMDVCTSKLGYVLK